MFAYCIDGERGGHCGMQTRGDHNGHGHERILANYPGG